MNADQLLHQVMDNQKWYEDNNCTHAHCPEGCDKPQPSLVNRKCFVCVVTLSMVSSAK